MYNKYRIQGINSFDIYQTSVGISDSVNMSFSDELLVCVLLFIA